MSATSSLSTQLNEAPVVQRLREQSFNRANAYLEHRDAVAGHHGVRAELLDELLDQALESPTPELLAELRKHGLLWSAIAHVIGVTDAAIRKWRRGESIETAHRRRLGRLVAFGRLYTTYSAPTSPTQFAEWLDTRIVPGFSAAPLQLLALSRDSDVHELQPLLDWMLGHPDGEQGEDLLDRYLGGAWREQAQQEQRFRIVTNSAGERVLLIDG